MSAQGAEVSAGVRAGDVLAGKYRVDRILGMGGMGVVVAAHHLQLDEKVAIKFLLPEAMQNAEAVARFDREARAAVKIKSEHVARVIDVGKLETGAPYMVMEYLEGSDLSAWVQERGAIPVPQAVEFVLQACEALAEAHAIGIVHRDLKPANLFCIRRADGLLAIKVLDFGISKTTGLAASGLGMTSTQAIMGSPLYMSPEQLASSKNVDARGDIWALGVILFELVTGRVPFEAEAITELITKILGSPTPLARQLSANVPEGIDRVIQRCLEKDREKRFSNVAEFAIALVDFGTVRSRASVERITRVIQSSGLGQSGLALPAASSGEHAAAATAPPWGNTQTTADTGGTVKRGALVGAGVVVALSLLLGGFFVMHTFKGGATTATGAAAPSATSVSPASPGSPSLPVVAPVASQAAPSVAPAASAIAIAVVAAPASPPDTSTSAASARPSHHSAASPPKPAADVPKPPAPLADKPAPARCDPPYYFDAKGNRLFKPECL